MRRGLLAVLGVDVVLVAAAVAAYPAFLRQPGSGVRLVEPLALLAVYALVVVVVTRSAARTGAQLRTLRTAARVGLALGALEVLTIAIETFTDLSGAASVGVTAPLILGPFVVWAVVAGRAARSARSLSSGVLAGVWCAMVTMIVGVSFGFTLALAAPDRLARVLTGDPDFVRSGWSDVRAFVPANTFDNAFTHLLGGLVVGSVMATAGAAIGSARERTDDSGTVPTLDSVQNPD